MATSTKTTMAGLLRDLWADAIAMFQMTAALPGAVQTVNAAGANTVKFYKLSKPGAAATAHTEDASISSTVTVTVSSVTATLLAYPVTAQVTQEMLDRAESEPAARDAIVRVLAGAIAWAVDSEIAGQFANFSNSIGAADEALTLENIMRAKTKIVNSGYGGSGFSVVLHPSQMLDVDLGIYEKLTQLADIPTVMNAGYIGSFAGMNFYQSERVPTTNVGGQISATGAIFLSQYAIGFGWDGQLAGMEESYNHQGAAAHSRYITTWTNFDSVLIDAALGCKLVSDVTDSMPDA